MKHRVVEVLMIYKLKSHLTRKDDTVWFGHCYTTAEDMSPFFVPVMYSERSIEEHCIVYNSRTGETNYYMRDHIGYAFRKAEFNKKTFEGTGFIVTHQEIACDYYTRMFENKIEEKGHFSEWTSFVRFDYNKFDADEAVRLCMAFA